MTAEMKWATAAAGLALLVAACGGATATEEPSDAPPSTEAPPLTSEPVVVDGPPAPDFALALDDGRGFILSDESKPVYMVFWAEW